MSRALSRLLCLLPLLSSCLIGRTTDNQPLDAALLQQLQPGVSDAGDVVRVLGAPVDVVQLGRRSAYEYRFTSTKNATMILIVVALSNVDERSDRIWVFFDENQVLTHVGVTLQGARTEYAMPWEDVHD